MLNGHHYFCIKYHAMCLNSLPAESSNFEKLIENAEMHHYFSNSLHVMRSIQLLPKPHLPAG